MLKSLHSALLWTVGILHFIMIFFIVAVGLIPFNAKTIFPMVRILARNQLRLMGLRLKVVGQEHFQMGRTYLMLGNHESMFDVFGVPAALPIHAVGLEAAYHFKIPLWGYLIRKWGNIPVYRNDLSRAIKSLQKARDLIGAGTAVIILPEGHRTLTGQIGEFKKGPFHLVKASKVDILPFALSGFYEFNNKNSWRLNPGTAHVVFGAPIPYKAFEDLTVEEIRDKVRGKMIELKVSAMG